jgi:Hypothetical protein (DUF2513)
VTGNPPTIVPLRLTWAGHEFLDAAREPSRWEKARDLVLKAGGATLPIWQQLLGNLLQKQIGL